MSLSFSASEVNPALEDHDIFEVSAQYNDVFSNRTPDIIPTAVIGTPSTPWRPLMLLALWFPAVLNLRLFNRLDSQQQNLLFDMVASALDDYYVWYQHPDYNEPDVITHTLHTVLYNFRMDPGFLAAVSLAPRAAHWGHQDFIDQVDEWCESREAVPANLHVQLAKVQSLFTPLPIVTPPDDVFPNGWCTPDIWAGFYLDAPGDETVVYQVPKSDNFIQPGKIPPQLHWSQFVKSDDFDDDFTAAVKVERAPPLAGTPTSPSISNSFSGTAPILPHPRPTPRPTPMSTPANVQQDKGKRRAVPASSPVISFVQKCKAYVGETPPSSKVRKTQSAQAISEARQEVPSPNSVKTGPRCSGRVRRRLHQLDDTTLLTLASYELSEDEFLPSSCQTTPTSPLTASGSRQVSAQREFPVKERPPGYYSHPRRIPIQQPAVDRSMNTDSDSEAVAAPFRELSLQPAESTSAEPGASVPPTSTVVPITDPIIASAAVADSSVAGPATVKDPPPTAVIAPVPGPSNQAEDTSVNKKTKRSRRAPVGNSLVEVPMPAGDEIEIPDGTTNFHVPSGYSVHSSITPKFHLQPPRVLGDFTLPPNLYGVRHRMENVRETLRARQVDARYATSSSFAPVLDPCETCGHHGVICFPQTGEKSCLSCRRSGLGCNLSSVANFANAADRAEGTAQFSLSWLDSLARDEKFAEQRMEFSIAAALLDISEYHTRRYKLTSALTLANQASPGYTTRLREDVDTSEPLKMACIDLEGHQEEYKIVPSPTVIFDENIRAELSQGIVDWLEGTSGKGGLPLEWSNHPEELASASKANKSSGGASTSKANKRKSFSFDSVVIKLRVYRAVMDLLSGDFQLRSFAQA
ncbi:hypothetical protein VKT23_002855 [Stygiomarasmius scandens]|uniref:Zn(2)-C6 fungal-type domain-containing protein n=1 Tax=Marasmiellus scandens TaxID=2682957 RepID=A0ABR1JY86_9AGAR